MKNSSETSTSRNYSFYLSGITWTEQYIKVTGITGSVFMVACAGGEMVGPVVIGVLFENLNLSHFSISCVSPMLYLWPYLLQCSVLLANMGKDMRNHQKLKRLVFMKMELLIG